MSTGINRLYTVSQKSIPNIFDCNLKTSYQNLVIFDLLSLGNAEAYIGWHGKLNSYLMASCVRNICTKNYQNLLIDFQVTVENVEDTFNINWSFCDKALIMASVIWCHGFFWWFLLKFPMFLQFFAVIFYCIYPCCYLLCSSGDGSSSQA